MVLVSTVALLTGCGGTSGGSSGKSASDGGKITLKFSAWDEIPDDVFKAFNKEHPNIKIAFVRIPGDDY